MTVEEDIGVTAYANAAPAFAATLKHRCALGGAPSCCMATA